MWGFFFLLTSQKGGAFVNSKLVYMLGDVFFYWYPIGGGSTSVGNIGGLLLATLDFGLLSATLDFGFLLANMRMNAIYIDECIGADITVRSTWKILSDLKINRSPTFSISTSISQATGFVPRCRYVEHAFAYVREICLAVSSSYSHE